MNEDNTLLFVYNADSGLFNVIADIGHKMFSPDTYACDLCALTHGYFSERQSWRAFVDSLACPCHFLHRDEFRRAYPDSTAPLPAVFRIRDGLPQTCLDAAAIAECADLDQLQTSIRAHCCSNNRK